MTSIIKTDLGDYVPVELDLNNSKLDDATEKIIRSNILLARDWVVLATAYSNRDGKGGHTGGAFSTCVEGEFLNSVKRGNSCIHPIVADGATLSDKVLRLHPHTYEDGGHRSIRRYVQDGVFAGLMPPDELFTYRRANSRVRGHFAPFLIDGMPGDSPGRLAHILGWVNGLALAQPHEIFSILSSDGVSYEGNFWEQLGDAISQQLPVKIFMEDNDMTIAGQRSKLDPYYNVESWLRGIDNLRFDVCEDPEDIAAFYQAARAIILHDGPAILLSKRRVIGTKTTALNFPVTIHDAIDLDSAIKYFEARGQDTAVQKLKEKQEKSKTPEHEYIGSGGKYIKIRADSFAEGVAEALLSKCPEYYKENAILAHNDVPDSSGAKQLMKLLPGIKVIPGIKERAHTSLCGAYSSVPGKVAIWTAFGAFGGQMILSEKRIGEESHGRGIFNISHAGCDGISDDTCHYGDDIGALANEIREAKRNIMVFPGDSHHMKQIAYKSTLRMINGPYENLGMVFIVSPRSGVPTIYIEGTNTPFFDPKHYEWKPGVADKIREGKDGYLVAVGAAALYRALDAVDRHRSEGNNVGLIYWNTFNMVDQEAMKILTQAPWVGVVEDLNIDTGLGSRMGTLLAEAGRVPKFFRMGITKLGNGGQEEQIYHQGLDEKSIYTMIGKYIKA